MKPYDASLNALIDAGPADWVRLLAPRVGLTPGPTEPVDTDLSVTAQSDKAFRLSGPPAAILHVELEAGARRGIPGRLLRYNVLLGYNRDEPVYSVIVLLKPGAGGTDLTGVYTRPNLGFRYAVVRVWEESIDTLIAVGPAVALVALITDEAQADAVAAADRIDARLRQPDVGGSLRSELWSIAGFFGGLRFDPKFVKQLVGRYGVILEESSVYQEAVEKGEKRGLTHGLTLGRVEGRAEAARDSLLLVAGQRFGAPPPAVVAAIQSEVDADRLRRMLGRLLDAAGWDDLLATP
ncbi:MAG TPA: hypothetical protein VD866_12880 [Urbifossiella sp.]|nr:hypothetical protein [Urbifossiella sp.]